MSDILNNRLYRKIKDKNFTPAHVAEVGVWHPETSNIFQFIKDGIKTTLVEPDPESIALIKSQFCDDNVTLHEVAIFETKCRIELCKREASTFVSSLTVSPTLVNDNFDMEKAEKFSVDAVLFNEIDDGSIDLISIDTEGSEWYVLQNMVSRPVIISLETHGAMYINPYIKQINDWLKTNNYTIWYRDKSDSVFVLKSKLAVSQEDRIKLWFTDIYLKLRAKKKRLSRRFKPGKRANK